VACVGGNGNGQLGRGTYSSIPSPDWDFVAGIDDAIDVQCGELSTCVLHQGGKVSCFGLGLSVGNNGGGNALTPYETIPDGAVAIACGDQHTCAIMDDASVKCWCVGARGLFISAC
jgi:alpha-tubulin suppressor-like RCC1 family protein